MHRMLSTTLPELLLALSEALELASAELSGHQLRTAYLAWHLSEAAGMSAEETEALFFAALLHDAGALSPEEKLDLRRAEVESPAGHCLLGEALFRSTPFLAASAPVILHHHRPWREWDGATDTVARQAQVLHLADSIEREVDRSRYILHQRAEIQARIRPGAGTEFAPDLVAAFERMAAREGFWLDLVSPHLVRHLREHGPGRHRRLDESHLAQAAELFSMLIDFRSPFTAQHSAGVAVVAAELMRHAGAPETDVAHMIRAGQLHDIGKMAVPTAILMKGGPLTDGEMAVMRQHTYHTFAVLQAALGGDRVASWAALHHEKLDGTGYPFHRTAAELDRGARAMAIADIYTALTEDRPYRRGLPAQDVLGHLDREVQAGRLDRELFTVLSRHHAEIKPAMLAAQARLRERYDALWRLGRAAHHGA